MGPCTRGLGILRVVDMIIMIGCLCLGCSSLALIHIPDVFFIDVASSFNPKQIKSPEIKSSSLMAPAARSMGVWPCDLPFLYEYTSKPSPAPILKEQPAHVSLLLTHSIRSSNRSSCRLGGLARAAAGRWLDRRRTTANRAALLPSRAPGVYVARFLDPLSCHKP